MNKILLCYISRRSGHHKAAIVLENALKAANRDLKLKVVNPFHYTNPLLSKMTLKTYMGLIRRTPEIWDYLYDNRNVKAKTVKIRNFFHKISMARIDKLLNEFYPDIVVCTQALPCCLFSQYKKVKDRNIKVAAVITDYVVHSYWINDEVDMYFVPSQEAADHLINGGISPARIYVSGIPIDLKFSGDMEESRAKIKLGLPSSRPLITIMGGGYGLGSLEDVITELFNISSEAFLLVIAGGNDKLYEALNRDYGGRENIRIIGYTDEINIIMEATDILISKPGGITSAETMAKGIPMIINSPLPGQERSNAKYLSDKKAALLSRDARDAGELARKLLTGEIDKKCLIENALRIGNLKSAEIISQKLSELWL
ncbi:MAG: glycosyltransferase, partial [Candidatus Aureabacteria bacterium]|nr:glycosyltransferase [Candidatus Auribacterota bacterium]